MPRNPDFALSEDKRVQTFSGPQGYLLYIYNGRLSLQLSDGTGTVQTYSSPNGVITPYICHFVGVSVFRIPGPPFDLFEADVYVDGAVTSFTSPTYGVYGSVSNSAPLAVGAQTPAFYDGNSFNGQIDELQLYNRNLTHAQAESLYTARGCFCKETCYTNSFNQWIWPPRYQYLNPLLGYASVRVCNYSGTAQKYHWTISGVPSGGTCTVPGPWTFSPYSGSFTVPAATSGQPHCWDVTVTVPHLVSYAYPARQCYNFTIRNDATGHCMECPGSFQFFDGIYFGGPTGDPASFLQESVTGTPGTVHFEVVSTWQSPRQISYELYGQDHEGDPSNQVVSLNGLPPGTPVFGTATIAPGDSVAIDVQAVLTRFEPLDVNEVVLAIDENGGTDYHPAKSIGLESVTAEELAGASEPPTEIPIKAPTRELTVSPNPFQDRTGIVFDLPSPESDVRIGVYDVAGRLVRDLYSGPLPAGRRQFEWDGRNNDGLKIGPGIFFIRAQTNGSLLRSKVVRMM